jgi:hypothetical protein
MRKTSYVVTFLLVLVSLALVSHFINLSIVSVKKKRSPRSQDFLAITRTDW